MTGEHLALITGASRGIGRAIARRIAAEGIPVAAVSRTLRAGDGKLSGSLEETVATIVADGGTAAAFAVDLGDRELDRPGLVTRIEAAMERRVDILVNKAAAARRYDVAFSDMCRDWFAGSVETNVWDAWDLTKAVVPGMGAGAVGWVLNISSRQAGPRGRRSGEWPPNMPQERSPVGRPSRMRRWPGRR